MSELRTKTNRHLTSLVTQLTNVNENVVQENGNNSGLEDIKKQFDLYLRRVEAEWTAEKESEPLSIDTGKYILLDLGNGLLDFRTIFDEADVDKNVINQIDKIVKDTKVIQKHTVTLDGGVSYRKFWEMGDEIIENVKQISNYIK